ncbi:MAG TPA: hypothetical protein VMV46_21290 [Thermoanaerobaculia bacterium]|nr:hypothetical protein [Thermoanaerobaculia bacterium]
MAGRREPRYPPLSSGLPAYVTARLHATATVLETTPEVLVTQALDARAAALPREKRELIDRIATSLLHAHEL